MLLIIFIIDVAAVVFMLYYLIKEPTWLKLFLRISRDNNYILAIYLILLFIFSIFITLIVYYFYYYIPINDIDYGRWEKSISTGISSASFIAIIITIKVWQDTDRRNINQVTLILFEKFRDDRFYKIRAKAWIVKNKWDNEKGYKERLISSSFENVKLLNKGQLDEDMKSIRDLIEFYTILSGCTGSEEAMRVCRYFYYGWWRRFLYEIARIHDDYYKPINILNEHNKKDYENYTTAISYTEKLKKLDQLCHMDHFDIYKDIHQL